MLDPLVKKILLSACVTTETVTTFLASVTAIGIGLEFQTAWIQFVGVLFGLISLGLAGTNLSNWSDYVRQFHQEEEGRRRELLEKERAEKREQQARQEVVLKGKLDDLDFRLVRNRDPKDQACLRKLRGLRESFWDELDAGHFCSYVTDDDVAQMEEMFQACVNSLEKSQRLWETATLLKGSHRDEMLGRRSKLILDVEESVALYEETLSGYLALDDDHEEELATRREELGRSLRTAQRVEERMGEIERRVCDAG